MKFINQVYHKTEPLPRLNFDHFMKDHKKLVKMVNQIYKQCDDDIMKISKHLPPKRQTLLFSATMPPKIRTLAKNILHNPAEINIAISKPNEAIKQMAYVCYEPQKIGLIEHIFSTPVESKTIIFSSSKIKVKDLAHRLKRMKYNVRAMHSDLEQSERDEVMLDFKNGKISILVATDIVSRGIDITDIGLVINYDVPHDPEDYIHRIGRTARAAATGAAVTLVCEEEQGKFYRIEKFMEREVEKTPLPESVGEGPAYTPEAFEHKGRGRSGRGRNSRRGGAKRGRDRSDKPRSEARKVADSNRTSNDSKATTDGVQKPQEDNKKRRYRGNRRRKRADKGNSVNTTQPTQEKA
jgi:superfamily II DNA/RNA helicase